VKDFKQVLWEPAKHLKSQPSDESHQNE